MKTFIETQNAPKAIGPYSQAVKLRNLLFISGQLGLNPEGNFAGADTASQTRQALKNIQAILEAADLKTTNIVKINVSLTDLADFGAVNEIFTEFFEPPYPARACVQVAKLPKDGKVEIEVIAG